MVPAATPARGDSGSLFSGLARPNGWDDEGHITRGELRSLHGLRRIWFDLGRPNNTIPLLHSAFWIQHRPGG